MANKRATVPTVIAYQTSPNEIIVGTENQWADDDDATYAYTASGYVGGDLVPEVGFGSPLPVVLLGRVMFDPGNTGDYATRLNAHWYIGEEDAGSTSLEVAEGDVGVPVTAATLVDDIDFNSGWSLAALLDAIQEGTASVRCLPGSPDNPVLFVNKVTVYELWLSTESAAKAKRRAPKRCFPRSDGRGRYPSTSMRSWPVEP